MINYVVDAVSKIIPGALTSSVTVFDYGARFSELWSDAAETALGLSGKQGIVLIEGTALPADGGAYTDHLRAGDWALAYLVKLSKANTELPTILILD